MRNYLIKFVQQMLLAIILQIIITVMEEVTRK